MLIKINGAIKKAGLFLIACSTMVCVCVVTTFSMFDDPPCKKRIMSQLFGHHNLNAIVCTGSPHLVRPHLVWSSL